MADLARHIIFFGILPHWDSLQQMYRQKANEKGEGTLAAINGTTDSAVI